MKTNYGIHIFLLLVISGCISFTGDDPGADSILYRINDERFNNNLTVMCKNISLDALANRRAHDLMNYSLLHDMALTHNIPRTGYPNEALKIYGIKWNSYGEINGYSTNNSSMITGWKQSSYHYESIINPTYKKAGVGMSKKNNTIWYLVLFTD